jgi:hypothetical protein
MKKVVVVVILLSIINCSEKAMSQSAKKIHTKSKIENDRLLTLTNKDTITLAYKRNIPLNIDSVQIENVQFESILIKGCGKGYFLFKGSEIYKKLNDRIKYLLYTQYIETETEPTALTFVQGKAQFYLNVINKNLAAQYCQNQKEEIKVLSKAYLLKIYSKEKQFNLVVVNDIQVVK